MAVTEPRDHMRQIARIAGMVGPGQPVGLAATAAKVHAHPSKPSVEELAEHQGHVLAPGRTFEAVQHNDHRRPRLGSGGEIEVDEVPVRGVDSAPFQRQPPAGAQVLAGQGLGMPVSEPPCGPKWGPADVC